VRFPGLITSSSAKRLGQGFDYNSYRDVRPIFVAGEAAIDR